MAVDKKWSVLQAIEIAKAFGNGGTQLRPDTVLEAAYEAMNKIQEDSEK